MLLGLIIAIGVIVYLLHLATQLTVETYRREWEPAEGIEAFPAQPVWLTSAGRLRIRADFHEASPRRDVAVVLTHGRGGNRVLMQAWALVFLREGVSAMTLDFRGYGESDGHVSTVAWHEQDDVQAAARWLKREAGFQRVVAFGLSMGGAACLMAAARDAEAIDGVIADSAFARMDEAMRHTTRVAGMPSVLVALAKLGVRWRYGIRAERVAPEDVIGRIAPRPVLIIHGEDDLLIPENDARRLFRRAGEPKSLWILPDGSHGHALWEAGEEYRSRLLEFIAAMLKFR